LAVGEGARMVLSGPEQSYANVGKSVGLRGDLYGGSRER